MLGGPQRAKRQQCIKCKPGCFSWLVLQHLVDAVSTLGTPAQLSAAVFALVDLYRLCAACSEADCTVGDSKSSPVARII